jgi:DNA-binding NarL/FixJ family response regulator
MACFWQAPGFVTETPLRILIAEDDERLATMVEQLLDGDDAVRQCEEHAPDLVLMDIGMPGRDGIEATRAIHARDSGQHVVIYTGSDEYDDIARADAAGAVGFLHKEALTSPDLADALHVIHANYVNSVPDPD